MATCTRPGAPLAPPSPTAGITHPGREMCPWLPAPEKDKPLAHLEPAVAVANRAKPGKNMRAPFVQATEEESPDLGAQDKLVQSGADNENSDQRETSNWRTISWPETAAGKIEEGLYKVRMVEHLIQTADRDIEELQKNLEGLAAVMDCEQQLGEYCFDIEDMRKARQEYRAVPLSEVKQRYLRQIHDLAISAIADYKARCGPIPAYRGPVNLYSTTIPLELPGPLAEAVASSLASHEKPAVNNGGDATC